jgi:subtilase family serine protease
MSRFTSIVAFLISLTAGFAGPAEAQTTSDAPPARVTEPIDATRTVTRPTAHRLAVARAVDQGALPPNQVIDHIQLALSHDAATEKRAEDFVASQYDPASPAYHRWIGADEFRARFGVAAADTAKVSGWLTSQGFTINSAPPGGLVIDFTGSADQVARAFHTEMHRFVVGGAPHIANASEPAIPAALAPVVVGVVSLNDVRPKPRYHKRVPAKDTDGQGDYAVAPADLATIYNFNAAFKAGYTGVGQTIAVVEDTDLYSNADWTTFRTTFGLNNYTKGSLTILHPAPKNGAACADPGVNSDDVEAALDVEWASAAAPNAKIVMAACAATAATDGVTLAIENLVESANPPPIISVSYGSCEAQNGAAGNAVYKTYYQQAAAQGISVFVATGDLGPGDCDSDSDTGSQYGVGGNGWATTAYNVAVGGTDFGDTAAKKVSTYWKSTNSAVYGSAKSYVPEIPWNDTCASHLVAAYNGYTATFGANGFCNSSAGSNLLQLGGGEGAPSGCATGAPSIDSVVSGSCKGWPKPSWQKGVLNVPADGVRDIPDVSLFAGDGSNWGHYYVTCYTDPANNGGPCTGDPASWAGGGGGTSYATPIWAGIQALVNQKMAAKQGNPAPILYKLAANEFGAAGDPACYAGLGNAINAKCVFYNITTDSDVSDCVAGSPDCYAPSGSYGVLSTSTTANKPAYNAHAGYNFPTGLGSVNVFNLLTKWP